MKAEKPMQEKTDNVISLLETKISTLNEENEQLSRDAQVRITNLQQEVRLAFSLYSTTA